MNRSRVAGSTTASFEPEGDEPSKYSRLMRDLLKPSLKNDWISNSLVRMFRMHYNANRSIIKKLIESNQLT